MVEKSGSYKKMIQTFVKSNIQIDTINSQLNTKSKVIYIDT